MELSIIYGIKYFLMFYVTICFPELFRIDQGLKLKKLIALIKLKILWE